MQEYGNFGIAINTNMAAQNPNTHNEPFLLFKTSTIIQGYKTVPGSDTFFFFQYHVTTGHFYYENNINNNIKFII